MKVRIYKNRCEICQREGNFNFDDSDEFIQCYGCGHITDMRNKHVVLEGTVGTEIELEEKGLF